MSLSKKMGGERNRYLYQKTKFGISSGFPVQKKKKSFPVHKATVFRKATDFIFFCERERPKQKIKIYKRIFLVFTGNSAQVVKRFCFGVQIRQRAIFFIFYFVSTDE